MASPWNANASKSEDTKKLNEQKCGTKPTRAIGCPQQNSA